MAQELPKVDHELTQPGPSPLMVKMGQVVSLASLRYALTARTVSNDFRARFDEAFLALKGVRPPGGEGGMGQDFLFQARKAGRTTVTIQTVNRRGEVLEERKYELHIQE